MINLQLMLDPLSITLPPNFPRKKNHAGQNSYLKNILEYTQVNKMENFPQVHFLLFKGQFLSFEKQYFFKVKLPFRQLSSYVEGQSFESFCKLFTSINWEDNSPDNSPDEIDL